MDDSETSENEDFLSADEFASDDDQELPNKATISRTAPSPIRPTGTACEEKKKTASQLAAPRVIEFASSDEDEIEHFKPAVIDEIESNSEDDIEVREYRKKPEPEPLPQEVTETRKPLTDLKPIIDIVKDVRPDELIGSIANQFTSNAGNIANHLTSNAGNIANHLTSNAGNIANHLTSNAGNIANHLTSNAAIGDITNQLTSNLSKGLATFQETSSSFKDLMVKNFAPEKEPIRLYNREPSSVSYAESTAPEEIEKDTWVKEDTREENVDVKFKAENENFLEEAAETEPERSEEVCTSEKELSLKEDVLESEPELKPAEAKFEEAMAMLEQLGVSNLDGAESDVTEELVENGELRIESALNEHIMELSNAFARIASHESKTLDTQEPSELAMLNSEIGLSEENQEVEIEPIEAIEKEVAVKLGERCCGKTLVHEQQIVKEHEEAESSQNSIAVKPEDIPVEKETEVEEGWDDWGDDTPEVEDIVTEKVEPQETKKAFPCEEESPANASQQEEAKERSVSESLRDSETPVIAEPTIPIETDVRDSVNIKEAKETGDQLKLFEEKETVINSEVKADMEGWDNWDSEGEDAEQDKKVLDVEEKEHGWDDWGTEEEEDSRKPSTQDEKVVEAADEGWDDWGDDDFEQVPPPEQVPSSSLPPNSDTKEWKGWDSFGQKKEANWALGGWGINKLLDTASAVTHGLTNVIESGLGVPDPETMARLQKEEEKVIREKIPQHLQVAKAEESIGLRNLVAGVGKIVEVAKVQEIGSRVLSGGLDTLETIGKKTMQVLQEGDPGLRKKRALIVEHGQVLSQVLKDARDRAVSEDRRDSAPAGTKRKQFETLFDDYQGLIHLEALEILSRQCQLRLEQIQSSLSGSKLKELQDTLEEVKELCTIDEEFDNVECDDFRESLTEAALPLKNELNVAKILEIHQRLEDWVTGSDRKESLASSLYDESITFIAELTAAVTQQFHKSGELLIVKERRKTVEEADALLQLSSHLCYELNKVSKQVSDLLQSSTDPQLELLISNQRTESDNAIAYIKQAFGLLIPLIQLGAT